jgi:hypothetical protein
LGRNCWIYCQNVMIAKYSRPTNFLVRNSTRMRLSDPENWLLW